MPAKVEPTKNSQHVFFVQFSPNHHSAWQLTAHRNRSPDWVPRDDDVIGLSPLSDVRDDLKRDLLRRVASNCRFKNLAVVADLDFHAV